MSERKTLNRQAQRSRRMLQDALIELLDEKPYEKISITEVAERADLSRPTFYAHFETKDDLILSYIDEIFSPFFVELARISAERPDPFMESDTNLYRITFSHWRKHRALLDKLGNLNIDKIIIERLKHYHRKVYETVISSARPDLSPALADYFISFISNASYGMLREWMAQDMRHDPMDMAALLETLIGPQVFNQIIEDFHEVID